MVNVRWATDDPNPKHIELTKRKTAEQIKHALEQQGCGTGSEQFDYPIDYQVRCSAVRCCAQLCVVTVWTLAVAVVSLRDPLG